MMEHLKQLAATTALNSMLSDSHFSICTVDKVGALLGVKPSGDAYNILSSLHCLKYEKIPGELRDAIPALLKECLGVLPVFQFSDLKKPVIEINPTPERGEPKSFLKSLGFGK